MPVASALLYPYLAQNHGVYMRVYRTMIMFCLLDGLDVVWYMGGNRKSDTDAIIIIPNGTTYTSLEKQLAYTALQFKMKERRKCMSKPQIKCM